MGLLAHYLRWLNDQPVPVFLARDESGAVVGVFSTLEKADAAAAGAPVRWTVDAPELGCVTYHRRPEDGRAAGLPEKTS